MGRSLALSAVLHAAAALAFVLFGARGPDGPRMPPVYQVNLVSAAELAPMRTRPAPRPRPAEPEEDAPEPLPEAEEKIPDPTARPEPAPPPADAPTPRPGPDAARETGATLPVTLEGRPFPFPWYLERLVQKIERNWQPSSNTLSATIHFRIDARGRIEDVEVSKSSGNFLFDQAARRAVEAASPMPPLPEGYTGDWLGVYFVFDTEVRPS